MGYFDEQLKRKNKLENDLFEEAYQKLGSIVTGENSRENFSNSMLLTRRMVEDIAENLDISIPYTTNEDYTAQFYMDEYFRPQGIMWREVELKDKWYKDATGIMLGTLKDGKTVALIPDSIFGYTYRDPDSGVNKRITSQNAGLFSKDALLFYRALPQKKLSLRDILTYMRKCITLVDFVVFALSTIAIVLLSMVTPAMTSILLGNVVANSDRKLLLSIFILLLVNAVTTLLFTIVKQLVLSRITTKVAIPLQSAFMMRALTAPVDKMKGFSAGDLGTRLGGMYVYIRALLSMFLSLILTAVCSLISFLQMFRFSNNLGLTAVAVTAIMLILYIVVMRKQYLLSLNKMEASAAESGLTYSLIDGMQKITLSGAEKRAFTIWTRVYRNSVQTTYDPPLILKVFGTLSTAILTVTSVVMLFMAYTSNLSTADYYSFTSSFGIVTAALAGIGASAVGFASALPVFRSLKPLREIVPETVGKKERVKALKGRIRLEHVTFGYQNDMPPVINDLSLQIREGEYVAIVGSTGCGKSTLMKLLLGFEVPTNGEIYYDDKPLSSLDLISVRKKIGTVLQNGDIFQGSIFSNITITGENLTLDDAWRAAEFAGIADDIRKMPLEMNTPLPDGGRGVSGGQKQRLLIARAIVTNPRILFFDEATSALDNLTQKAVSDAIGDLHCTRLVIAHRLSTIQNCDRIFCLDKGKIVEEGNYEELMNKQGFFAELVRRQQI